jgi:ATP-dependent exoDNAse (exonuclease V) beta subunit
MEVVDVLNRLEYYDDSLFRFDEELHRYTYNGEDFISVTTFISKFHKKFDQEYWSKKKADDRGISQEEILSEWKELNDRANIIGSATHQWIEDYFNKIWRPLPTDSDIIHRINKFNKIWSTDLHKLEPIKFEVRIFSKKYKIAGMIDALFLYKGKLFIVDYKTNKKFTTDDNLSWKEFLLEPFQSYLKTHLNEYSIQISLYSLILRECGLNVTAGYLVYIGPGDEDAKIYKCHNFVDILEDYLNSNI